MRGAGRRERDGRARIALRVVQQTMVDTGLIVWADVARSCRGRLPASAGSTGHGSRSARPAASVTFYDPSPVRAFSTDALAGRSLNSPYLGRSCPVGSAGRSTAARRRSSTALVRRHAPGSAHDLERRPPDRRDRHRGRAAPLIVWSWLRRTRRDSAIAATRGRGPAAADCSAVFPVLYVATTKHGEPLERLASWDSASARRTDLTDGRRHRRDLRAPAPSSSPPTRLVAVPRRPWRSTGSSSPTAWSRMDWRTDDGTVVDSYLRPGMPRRAPLADSIRRDPHPDPDRNRRMTSTCSRPTAAVLVLEDGTRHVGRAYGARGATLGEVVFSTGMTGYQETLTDPRTRARSSSRRLRTSATPA